MKSNLSRIVSDERITCLLDERREPADKSESLASIAISGSSGSVRVLLVESQPYVRYQPSKLDHNPGTLETYDAKHGRQCHICHGQCLRVAQSEKVLGRRAFRTYLDTSLDKSKQLNLVLRNELCKCYKDGDLQRHLSMILHAISAA